MMDFHFKGASLNLNMNSVQAETVKTEKIDDKDMMGTLTMTVAGTLASRMYKYKMTTDIMLGAAGGAAFLAGEVLAFLKLKKVMKDIETEVVRDEKGKIDQKQIEVLEKLKQSYKEAKGTATTKKTLQMAAAAAFAAAGVMAYMMEATNTAALTACTGGVTTALGSLSASLAGCTGPQAGVCVAQIGACTTLITTFQTHLMSHELARQAPGTPSIAGLSVATTNQAALTAELSGMSACTGFASAGLAVPGACSALIPAEKLSDTGGTMMAYDNQMKRNPLYKDLYKDSFKEQLISKSEPNESWISKYFSKAANLIFPVAKAELFSAMGIASSGAVTFLLATSATLGAQLDFFMLVPKNRAMVWAGLGALTYAATSATENQIKQIDGNIQKIDQILNSMYSNANGVATSNGIGVNNPKIEKSIVQDKKLVINENLSTDVDLKALGGTSLSCVTGSDPEKCPSFGSQLNAQTDVKTMPDTIQAQISSISKLTDALNGRSRISGSTLKLAQSVAGQQNALSLELKKQQKNLQEKLRSSGSNIDLAAENAKLEASMKATVQKQLDARKTSASQMYASFGGGGFGSGASGAVGSDASKDADANKLAAKNAAFKGSMIAIPAAVASMNPKLNASDAELEAQLAAEKKAADDAAAAAAAGQTASIDDYDLKNDITQDKESSIFDLISNRYQKSGYPRLFKRVK